MITFIITDFNQINIPVTTHTHTFSLLEHHIDWFCTTYPLLASFRDAMSWTIEEGEESRIYLQTHIEGRDTIRVSNSLNEYEFYIPKLDTYVQLNELFTLILPVNKIHFRINYKENLWDLQNHLNAIHPSCNHIHLFISDEFYILLELDSSDWIKS